MMAHWYSDENCRSSLRPEGFEGIPLRFECCWRVVVISINEAKCCPLRVVRWTPVIAVHELILSFNQSVEMSFI